MNILGLTGRDRKSQDINPIEIPFHLAALSWDDDDNPIYPLVMTNTSPWEKWPIEIDGLPIKHGDFPWLC